jgi:hypothetical protein
MHPGLKREKDPSQDLRSRAEEVRAQQTLNRLQPSAEEFQADGAEPRIRKPISAEKFAYLRAQVQVFRRSR